MEFDLGGQPVTVDEPERLKAKSRYLLQTSLVWELKRRTRKHQKVESSLASRSGSAARADDVSLRRPRHSQIGIRADISIPSAILCTANAGRVHRAAPPLYRGKAGSLSVGISYLLGMDSTIAKIGELLAAIRRMRLGSLRLRWATATSRSSSARRRSFVLKLRRVQHPSRDARQARIIPNTPRFSNPGRGSLTSRSGNFESIR